MLSLDFEKGQGLIPVIIQEESTHTVLMLGFMNQEAWDKTQKDKKVWFYSRTKKRLWMKGETSGNTLLVKNIAVDCDNDTLLIQVQPKGNVCHKGTYTCFQEVKEKKND